MAENKDGINKTNQHTLDDVLNSKLGSCESRTYSSYMEELGKDELLEGLLGHGLFTEKIPPLFTSESFYEWCKSVKDENKFKSPGKDFIRYESMRNIPIPRLFAIPHPIAYRNLCKTLAESWGDLQKHFKEKTDSQTHKISRLHIRKLKDRKHVFEMKNKKHIFEMNYKNFYKDIDVEPDLLIGSEIVVKADISNCFPSIYTHAIPWALIGKPESKNKKNEKDKYFNKIDEFTRHLKYGETHGILIGPHSSNLIFEIILVAVDKKLYDSGHRYIRYIDDYICYLKNHDEAEKFLLELSLELKKYELTLNHKKTEILDLPLASTEHWVRKLNAFQFSNKKNYDKKFIKYNELKFYLDLAIELMQTNGNDAATINYAIKVISKKYLGESTKRYYLKRIHHLVLLYPYLILLLDKYVFEPFKIQKEEIKFISDNIFKLGISKNLWEAVSYSIFFALKYDFKHDGKNLSDKAINSDDCIFLTLAYLYDKREKIELDAYIKLAKKKYESNFDQYWLFIYEVRNSENLPEPFKTLKKENISFVKKEYL